MIKKIGISIFLSLFLVVSTDCLICVKPGEAYGVALKTSTQKDAGKSDCCHQEKENGTPDKQEPAQQTCHCMNSPSQMFLQEQLTVIHHVFTISFGYTLDTLHMEIADTAFIPVADNSRIRQSVTISVLLI